MSVLTKQQQVAKLAKENRTRSFTSLNHFIDYDWLHRAYQLTRKGGAAGVDGITAREYEQSLKSNLENLLDRIKTGTYRAPAIRRVYIPKGNGEKRPLGIPTFEDKIVQRAVVMLLEPIYEQDFHDFSYGFRRGRSAHNALQNLRNNIMDDAGKCILDVDVQKYFDTINHHKLRHFLSQRVVDGVIRKLIDKWLKAGVLESGQLYKPTMGTPQGGVISPLLANIYLHYVLDEWFVKEVKPRLKGKASITRYADDFVMVFSNFHDCNRVQRVLSKRFDRFNLKVHPSKTRQIDFRYLYKKSNKRLGKPVSFDFLGFTHYWGSSRKGWTVLYQKTSKDRFSRALKEINFLCRNYRHKPLDSQCHKINEKLIGHYAYFGITGNARSLRNLLYETRKLWRKWLSRRSRKSYITWSKFLLLEKRYQLKKPKIYHKYSN